MGMHLHNLVNKTVDEKKNQSLLRTGDKKKLSFSSKHEGRKLGRNSHEYEQKEDERRILIAEKNTETCTREAKICPRQEQKDAVDDAAAARFLLYGAGIDNSI
ncbi:hypothetical protein KM043_018640 [Ampulex compressa]|nr:hypothetical protein KM043_018640 [Ampulex compressa]